jgi:hypothetical protein
LVLEEDRNWFKDKRQKTKVKAQGTVLKAPAYATTFAKAPVVKESFGLCPTKPDYVWRSRMAKQGGWRRAQGSGLRAKAKAETV